MIYVDSIVPCYPTAKWRHGESCHLYADRGDDGWLHEFAAMIGLKREWFQPGKRLPYYDLTRAKRAEAVQAGAIERTIRETGLHMKGKP